LSESLETTTPAARTGDPWPDHLGTGGPERGQGGRWAPTTSLDLAATTTMVGEYRWIENALYAMLGEWVTDMPVAAVQVHLDGQSLRHAWHADLWADRLPVLAGADPAGATAPSAPSAAAFAALSGVSPSYEGPGSTWPPADQGSPGRPSALPRLAGLYRVILPRLITSYERHLRAVDPVIDGAVARALRLVLNDEIEDWHAGERLVQRLVTRPHDVAAVHEFLQRLESAVVGAGVRSGLADLPESVPEV
jgi:hypothetical protein